MIIEVQPVGKKGILPMCIALHKIVYVRRNRDYSHPGNEIHYGPGCAIGVEIRTWEGEHGEIVVENSYESIRGLLEAM